jgi:tRNA threonylcarbamoyl adenosine modification protein (Sua5/YciO/YrdC/YwlC family)
MNRLKIWNDNPSEQQINDIADAISNGEIVIMPTDTTYAIMGDALNVKSVDKICRIKGINTAKTNLSIICSDISMAAEYAKIDNQGFSILKEYTPGALTVLFRSASTLPKAFKGRKTVGIRIPACDTCRQVAERLGHPLLTTSIEYQDEDYAINTELIAEAYEGIVDMLVDCGDGMLLQSTIVDCTADEPIIIREGALDLDL